MKPQNLGNIRRFRIFEFFVIFFFHVFFFLVFYEEWKNRREVPSVKMSISFGKIRSLPQGNRGLEMAHLKVTSNS